MRWRWIETRQRARTHWFALGRIEISLRPIPVSDLAKIFVGRAEETEAHIMDLRLSPRDTVAYVWMWTAGAAKNRLGSWEQASRGFDVGRGQAKLYSGTSRTARGFGGRSKPIAILRTRISLAAVFARLGSSKRVRGQAGLALNPSFAVAARLRRRTSDIDLSGTARAHSRRPAQGRSARTMTAAPHAVLAAFLPSAACAAARRAIGMRKGEHET